MWTPTPFKSVLILFITSKYRMDQKNVHLLILVFKICILNIIEKYF